MSQIKADRKQTSRCPPVLEDDRRTTRFHASEPSRFTEHGVPSHDGGRRCSCSFFGLSAAVSPWILLGILCLPRNSTVQARVLPSAHGTKPFNSLQSYYKSVDRQLSHRFPELNDAPYKMAKLEEAPKYLLQLMRLQSTRPPSNTVRGFQAKIGMFELSYAFTFFFPSFDSNEHLLRAEFHLFVKRLVSRNRRRRTQLTFHLVQPNGELFALRSYSMAQSTVGWYIFDVSSFVEGTVLTLAKRRKSVRIALTFEARKANGKIQEVSLKRFVGHAGQGKPFIVIFSNDSRHLSIDQITRESPKLRLPVPPIQMEEGVDDDDPRLLSRQRRQVAPLHDGFGGPAWVQRPTHRRRHQKRKRRRRRKKKQRRLSMPQAWPRPRLGAKLPPMRVPAGALNVSEEPKQCGVQPMILDFRDIGWTDWIISPQSFPMNTCGGPCQHLLWQSPGSVSNHAFLQGIVNLISLPGSKAPPLSCVPVELASQTILYYDTGGNVALREFPDMVVKRCGCR